MSRPTGFQRFIRAFCEVGAIRLLILARDIFQDQTIELSNLNEKQVNYLAAEIAARWRIGEPQSEIRICPLCLSAFAPGPETARLCDLCFQEVLSAETEHYARQATDAGEGQK